METESKRITGLRDRLIEKLLQIPKTHLNRHTEMYGDKVMDHFKNPRNQGTIDDADGTGEVGNPQRGDIMKIYLKIKDDIIENVRFRHSDMRLLSLRAAWRPG